MEQVQYADTRRKKDAPERKRLKRSTDKRIVAKTNLHPRYSSGWNPNPKGSPWFTKENASAYGKKGQAKLKLQREKARAELQLLKDSPVERVIQALGRHNDAVVSVAGNGYVTKRLATVRMQLERIDAMILVETNAQTLDRLASAQAKLSEQERILDGRPLPGSQRPPKLPRQIEENLAIEPE